MNRTEKIKRILDEVAHLDDGHGNIRVVVEQWVKDNPRRHVKTGVREVAEIWREAEAHCD